MSFNLVCSNQEVCSLSGHLVDELVVLVHRAQGGRVVIAQMALKVNKT